MAFDGRAVAAGRAEGVPIAPVVWDADGVGWTRDDGPAPWRSGNDLYALARYDTHVAIDVENDFVGRECDDAVPRAAT
jgi:hypothetical protein